MRITLGQIIFFQTELRKEKSIYCGLNFNQLAVFFESALLMIEGDPADRKNWDINHHYDS